MGKGMKPLVSSIAHVQMAIPIRGEDEARVCICDPFGNRLEFMAKES